MSGEPVRTCSQALGSMVTGPAAGSAKKPLQDFETMYIGVAGPDVVRQVSVCCGGAIQTERNGDGI